MLEICNLKKSFKSKKVLKDVSFEIKPGEIVCLLGNNGAGKTTIINCILKLVKPDSGKILLDGKDIWCVKNKEYFAKVNALLESSINIYGFLTGRENIEYFAGLMNLGKECRERAAYFVREFELAEALDEQAGSYSRGMQQKLALVIALMSRPQVLLLDERALGLDIRSKLSVINILNRVIRTENICVLLTTHQMDIVQKLDGRILLLSEGIVRFFDRTKYESQNYVVTYIKDNEAVQETVSGTFDQACARFKNQKIVEIRREDLDLEKVLLEELNESD